MQASQNSQVKSKGLAVVTADTILTTQYPDPAWAIPNLLPVGLTILAGAPKLGKSWLALQIAQAVASGGEVLGERVTRGSVLYLALEDFPRRLQARMKKQSWASGLPVEFLTLGKFDGEIGDLKTGGGEKLANQIKARGYRFVVIDTLSRSLHGDQIDAQEMTRGLTPLHEIAQAQNIALLLVDHHRKSKGENPDAIADILGSTAKGAIADTILGLYRERGKSGAKLSITGRDVEEQTLSLTMDWQAGTWYCDGVAGQVALTFRRQEIIDALTTLGEAQVDTIAKAINQDRGNTYRRLQDLLNIGKIKKIAKGKSIFYAI